MIEMQPAVVIETLKRDRSPGLILLADEGRFVSALGAFASILLNVLNEMRRSMRRLSSIGVKMILCR